MSIVPQFESNYPNLLYDALDHAHECMVLTDPKGHILYMNKPYQKFLHVTDEVVGRHVTEVIENTRMHIVAQTGQAEIAHVQRIQGHDMIASRIPITRDGQVVAVIGTVMFQDVQQLYALTATVDRLRNEMQIFRGAEMRRKSRKRPMLTTTFGDIIGGSRAMVNMKQLAVRVARSDTTVLITGESGTGKELVASAIHVASKRGLGPFVTVNCAAIPDSLLESELFGYEGGAFTGAAPSGKQGKFELAQHGTILLDEVGDMPLNLQAKLLRVLQEREVERVGGLQPIPLDVRVISSTHRNLAKLMNEGMFREDLFYRLNVLNLNIPPLRQRAEDIPAIAMSFLNELCVANGTKVGTVSEAAWGKLKSHHWPGNVRELKNVLERALLLMDDGVMEPQHITFPFQEVAETEVVTKSYSSARTVDGSGQERTAAECDRDAGSLAGRLAPVESGCSGISLKERVAFAEKIAIVQALQVARGNKREAAKLLGISKSALYQKLAEYQVASM